MGVNVANKLFLTLLHSKSKKKVNDVKLDTYEKLPNNYLLLTLCLSLIHI